MEAIEQLRAEIAKLAARVEALESAVPQTSGSANGVQAAPTPQPQPQAAPEPKPEAIPEHVLAAISACVAAYLGERVHIRQIRLVASPAWAQQGRVYIQASHTLH
jgi:methylmalonyl-CoA carboxyltransferase large subunit